MNAIELTLLVVSVLVGLSQTALAVRCWRYLRRHRRQTMPRQTEFTPRIALICPCKGLEDTFEENIQALLQQDYPDHIAIFVVSSQNDPAYALLKPMVDHHPHSRLLVAGAPQQCSDKVNNLLVAVSSDAARLAEVLAFADTDGTPHRAWLRALIAPLAEPEVGLVTGYRWYQPRSHRFWSWMRAVGNNVGLAPYMVRAHLDAAWGGAMAVRRDYFEGCGVVDVWARALDDDLTLAQAIRQMGKRIVFVPDCLTISSGDCTLKQYYNWLLRQSFMVKQYHPRMWRLAFASFVPMVMMLLGSLLLMISIGVPAVRTAALILLIVVPLQSLGGILTACVFDDTKTALWVPIGLLFSGSLSAVAFTASIFVHRITWRGVTYEVRAPDDVIISSSLPTKAPS